MINKKEVYRKDLIKRKGLAWVQSHEALLDEQFEFIENMGDPEDIDETESGSDIVISDGNS